MLLRLPSTQHLAPGILTAGLLVALAQIQVMHAAQAFNWQAMASKPHWVVGWLAAVDEGTQAARVTAELRDVTVFGMPTPVILPKLRLGVAEAHMQGFAVGDGVAVRVQLYPSQGPQFAGDYDFRLGRLMNRTTYQGFAMGKPEATNPPAVPTGWKAWLHTYLELWQTRLKTATAPYADGVLTSLLVAEQRQVPQGLQEAYRRAGLSHLLAVSGLQLTLVGGGVFWLVRWLLALWPALALRVNGKAIGAVSGLLAAGLYAVLAGAPVSVQRALLMVALLLLAVLLGRLRSLPRAWAVAMMAVLVANPSAVMSAGFQLSFAAVGGLILLGMATGHPQGWFEKAQWLGRSSVVAAWATAPLLVMHFGQFNLVGVLANVVAIPAMGPITLVAFAGLVMMPFGLHEPLFWAAGQGAGWVNAGAAWVASWPLATVNFPPSTWPLVAAAALGGLWLVLARKPWGTALSLLLLMAVGLAGWASTTQTFEPQLTLLEGGKVAVLETSPTHSTLLWGDDTRLLHSWQRNGHALPVPDTQPCAEAPCSVETPLGRISRMTTQPTAEDCALNRLIISSEASACPSTTLAEGAFAYGVVGATNVVITLPTCSRLWHKVGEECWKHY